MLSSEHYGLGLCWLLSELSDGTLARDHHGGDPGIVTMMAIQPDAEPGVLVFCTEGSDLRVLHRV